MSKHRTESFFFIIINKLIQYQILKMGEKGEKKNSPSATILKTKI